MATLGQRWKQMPAAVRKPFIFIIGSSVIFTGMALLVLPGPGWAAIFLGFAILATEFAFAEVVRAWFVKEVKIIGRNSKAASRIIWDNLRRKL